MTIRQTLTGLAAVGLILLAAGCATTMKSKVVTFHEGPLPKGETIKVVPMDAGKKGSLEFNTYADMIRKELREIGYEPVEGDARAELLAEVDYSVSEGRTETRSTNRGFARYHFYYGHYHDPFYYGFYNDWPLDVYTYTVYERTLRMNIVRQDGEREVLFEGRVQSIGRENEINEVMPYLVTAMFTNFPGESGMTKVVTIDKK